MRAFPCPISIFGAFALLKNVPSHWSVTYKNEERMIDIFLKTPLLPIICPYIFNITHKIFIESK